MQKATLAVCAANLNIPGSRAWAKSYKSKTRPGKGKKKNRILTATDIRKDIDSYGFDCELDEEQYQYLTEQVVPYIVSNKLHYFDDLAIVEQLSSVSHETLESQGFVFRSELLTDFDRLVSTDLLDAPNYSETKKATVGKVVSILGDRCINDSSDEYYAGDISDDILESNKMHVAIHHNYINKANSYPKLDSEDDNAITRIINSPALSVNNKKLLSDVLILSHLRDAIGISLKYASKLPTITFFDCISSCSEAQIKSVSDFNPYNNLNDANNKFCTYYSFSLNSCISQELMRLEKAQKGIHTNQDLVLVNRLKTLVSQHLTTDNMTIYENGRTRARNFDDILNEACPNCKISYQRKMYLYNLVNSSLNISIDTPVGGDGDSDDDATTIGYYIEDTKAFKEMLEVEKKLDAVRASEIMNCYLNTIRTRNLETGIRNEYISRLNLDYFDEWSPLSLFEISEMFSGALTYDYIHETTNEFLNKYLEYTKNPDLQDVLNHTFQCVQNGLPFPVVYKDNNVNVMVGAFESQGYSEHIKNPYDFELLAKHINSYIDVYTDDVQTAFLLKCIFGGMSLSKQLSKNKNIDTDLYKITNKQIGDIFGLSGESVRRLIQKGYTKFCKDHKKELLTLADICDFNIEKNAHVS